MHLTCARHLDKQTERKGDHLNKKMGFARVLFINKADMTLYIQLSTGIM